MVGIGISNHISGGQRPHLALTFGNERKSQAFGQVVQ